MKKFALTLAGLSFTGIAFAGPIGSPSTIAPAPAPGMGSVSGLNYNTVELGYVHTWFDDTPGLDDAPGVRLDISYEIIDRLYLALGGSYASVNTPAGSTDFWTGKGGIGTYMPITGRTDFVAEMGALFYGISNRPNEAVSKNDADLYISPQIRTLLTDSVELNFGAAWANVDLDNEWAGFTTLYFGLGNAWDLSLNFTFGDVLYSGAVGVRFNY